MDFDIIVVGGGHAGIEAAYITSKKSLKVLLISNHLDLIGQMSCNPSIGGVAKGNIVREIDALGGLMGKLIDHTGIHFKMLNRSKGVAVWGNRAQADKIAYRTNARKWLEEQDNIFLLQGMVLKVTCKKGKANGVMLDSGERISAKCVILAMGTFLDGIAHIGLNSFPAGRIGEPPSLGLTENLKDFGIKSERLKTGTSPRIDGKTVNFQNLLCQPGDEEPWPFSYSTEHPLKNRAVCWVGKTTPETHQIIKENLDRSPLYTGKITSIGPRYCPSIEDKVIRFGERDGHTLFLEPETLENQEMYLNGLSSSLPFDVQLKMVHSVKGLEKAAILRPAYGIEYSFFLPQQLYRTLESRVLKNLYFSGQINGTSGYEEAACQGLVAGINAAQRILGDMELVLERDSSYIGVLIDDLVTRGTDEPYRMFTSRAEYRLLLRQDNCDERLSPLSYKLGFLDEGFFEKRKRVWQQRRDAIEKLKYTKILPGEWVMQHIDSIEIPYKAEELLKRPAVTLDHIKKSSNIDLSLDRELLVTIEADIKYSGFVAKQRNEIEQMKKLESSNIPADFNYDSVRGLLKESQDKLKKIRPQTLGQASRITGVTPADITILALYLKKK